MKKKKIMNAWDKIEPNKLAEQRMKKEILKRIHIQKYVKVSLVIALGLLMLFIPNFVKNNDSPSIRQKTARESMLPIQSEPTFVLEKSDATIEIALGKKNEEGVSEGSLIYLTEKELMADSYNGLQVAAFYGKIQAIHNLEVSFANNQKAYWAVAELVIIEDLRTDLQPGTIVTIGLSGGDNAFKIGDSIILMPVRYDEISVYQVGNETLYLQEIAEYGLPDSVRWQFIETSGGLAFEISSYPSFRRAKNLEQVAELIRHSWSQSHE